MKKIHLLSLGCLLALFMMPLSAAADDYVRGDADLDGQITPADISALINYLLNGEWPQPATPDMVYTVNGVTFKMIPVEGGTFMMGGTEEQGTDAGSSEKPVHQVTLSSYAIGETEVTQELWEAVMGSNPSQYQQGPTYPADAITWADAKEFAAALSTLTGQTFRLPTEAEWEFAARGGNLSQGYKYPGSNNIDDVAWYGDSHGDLGRSHPVAQKQPNELGLYDMAGNVKEWTNDYYARYTADAVTNPTGPASGAVVVNRGGEWPSLATQCRVSTRNAEFPDANSYNGLRLVMEMPQ